MTPSPHRRPPLEDEDLLAEILLRLSPLPSSLLRIPRLQALAPHPLRPPLPPPLPPPPPQPQTSHPRLHRQRTQHCPPQTHPGSPKSFPSGALLLPAARRRRERGLQPPRLPPRPRAHLPRIAERGAGMGSPHRRTRVSWAVLRAAGEIHHFQVLVVGNDEKCITRALACVYSSETGVWGGFISTPVPSEDSAGGYPTMVVREKPSVMVGNSVYWLLTESLSILEFHLHRNSLSVITVPVNKYSHCRFSVMPAKGGGLGFLFLPDSHAQLWKRKTECDGVASWVRERSIDLHKLLSMNSEEGGGPLMILGCAEFSNVVILWTVIGIFMVDLESLQFKRLFETDGLSYRHPFESVYIPETGIGAGQNGAGH